MTNIINIGDKPPLMVFVCNCGCISFSLMSDGSTECSACGISDEQQDGAWANNSPEKTEYDGEHFADVQGNNSIKFAKMRIGKLARDSDIALVLVAKDGGSVHAWCKSETPAQMEWMREKLQVGGDLIERASTARHDG